MVFLGCLFEKEQEKEILINSKTGVMNQANNFQWNLIKGFVKLGENIKIINVLPVGTYPKFYKKLIIKSRKWKYGNCQCKEIGCINLIGIKQIIRYIKLKKIIKKSVDKNIIIYSTYIPFLKSIYKLDNSYNITLIVTDLGGKEGIQSRNFIKRQIRKLYDINLDKYISRIDKFVILTDQMKNPLKINKRPYTIVEGICSKDSIIPKSRKDTSTRDKIILYSGTLNYEYGIMNLIKAFNMINNKNIKLWICGKGNSENEIIANQKINKNIKYFGFLTNKKIKELQLHATILINPRMNTGLYTKYSFPSKTIEYMLSGKPIVMYKLDGIPSEYDNYLYYVNGNKIEDLRDKIIEILNKDSKELQQFGKKAQEWVIKEKNNIKQCKKILDMIYYEDRQ